MVVGGTEKMSMRASLVVTLGAEVGEAPVLKKSKPLIASSVRVLLEDMKSTDVHMNGRGYVLTRYIS